MNDATQLAESNEVFLDAAHVSASPEYLPVTDEFDREVDDWLDDLEGQLAPAGRHTPIGASDDEGPSGRLVMSHPSTLAPLRTAVPGIRWDEAEYLAPELDDEMVGLERRKAQLAEQHKELVRTEALVAVMKELAAEIRSVRRDVDQIKAVIAKLRRLAEAKRRAGGSGPIRTVRPTR